MMHRRSDDYRLSFENGVRPLAACSLKVGSALWPFAEANKSAIEAHWAKVVQINPRNFNGVVHLVEDMRFDNCVLDASLLKTDFKSYLFWRDQGFRRAGRRRGRID